MKNVWVYDRNGFLGRQMTAEHVLMFATIEEAQLYRKYMNESAAGFSVRQLLREDCEQEEITNFCCWFKECPTQLVIGEIQPSDTMSVFDRIYGCITMLKSEIHQFEGRALYHSTELGFYWKIAYLVERQTPKQITK